MLQNLNVLLVAALFVGDSFAQKCMSQSCAIAALSGSTNEGFDEIVKGAGGKTPQGSNNAGKNCITKYYKQLGLKAPETPIIRRVVDPAAYRFMSEATNKNSLEVEDLEKRQAGGCKPYINLFARGTTEPGTMGSTVGPALQRALGAKWMNKGVSYTADIAGDNCIGFPGGIKCVDQLAAVHKQCPEAKLFLSGYSQGAMVARICAAYSKEDVRAKIKGVVVFGDPFNGASLKGFPQDTVKTFCSAADGVCSGKFSITAAHLAYASGPSISQAASWMNQRAASA